MTTMNPFQNNIHNLEELADVLGKLLHSPITIEDANHKLLSYSTHHGITDPIRISTIIERRVPEKFINQLWKEGVIPSLLSSKEPVYFKTINDAGLGDRLAISIWNNDEVIGYIWAIEINKSFSKEDFILLKQAAVASKNIFLRNKLKTNQKEEHYQEFFWKLLTGYFHSNEIIIEKFHEIQLETPSMYSIVIFQYSQEITDDIEHKINYLLNTFQKPKILLYTIEQKKLICLTSLNKNDSLEILYTFSNEFIEKMNERFSITSIVQGLSELQNDLLKIESSYHEALTVLSIKKRFPTEVNDFHSYQKLGFYRYLNVLLESKKYHDYENDSLTKLKEYDQKYQNNLVETLEVYLSKDCNVNFAAKILNIHPNTLTYRIKRISEIGEIDLKNITQKMTLFIDLKLERCSKS